jgi:two-component system sensor histidine kinase KdpD
VRVRETFPDRILDEANEVVLVDLTPEALQERLIAGKVYPRERVQTALDNFFRIDNLAALRELVLRELAEDVEARRAPVILDPLSQQAVAERILALVTPEPRSQRLLRRLASILGAHFLEVEGDNLVETVKRVARERGSTYVFVGTPDESRLTEIRRGWLVSALIRTLPGIDIRVVADRALRERKEER